MIAFELCPSTNFSILPLDTPMGLNKVVQILHIVPAVYYTFLSRINSNWHKYKTFQPFSTMNVCENQVLFDYRNVLSRNRMVSNTN